MARLIATRGTQIEDMIDLDDGVTVDDFLAGLREEEAKLGTELPNGATYQFVWGGAFLHHAADPAVTLTLTA